MSVVINTRVLVMKGLLRVSHHKRLCDTKNKTTSAIWEQQSKANNEIDWEGVKILDQETVVDIIRNSRSPYISDVSIQL